MIQQIYITDYLSDAAANTAAVIESVNQQCPVLLKADWEALPVTPLNALFSTLSAQDSPSPGISTVSAILRARQAWAAELPALCLLPVHLGLQRDTFSLHGTIQLAPDVYLSLTETLQQQFLPDFIVHPTAEQRYWWIQPLQTLEVNCPWPQDCLYQQAFQWQPQGKHASLIRQWTNESQMLLHQLSQNTRLPDWPETLNSLWFASVPDMPVWKHSSHTVFGAGAVFDGLQLSQLPSVKSVSLTEIMENPTITNALMIADHINQVDWQTLFDGLQRGRVSALEIVLPLAERSVRITYKKRYRWQFWRKTYTVQGLLDTLEAALPTFKLPEAL